MKWGDDKAGYFVPCKDARPNLAGSQLKYTDQAHREAKGQRANRRILLDSTITLCPSMVRHSKGPMINSYLGWGSKPFCDDYRAQDLLHRNYYGPTIWVQFIMPNFFNFQTFPTQILSSWFHTIGAVLYTCPLNTLFRWYCRYVSPRRTECSCGYFCSETISESTNCGKKKRKYGCRLTCNCGFG